MSRLAQLDIIDIRFKLARAAWTIGKRRGPALSGTLHYNGPARTALASLKSPTIDQEIAHFRAIARDHIHRVWGHTRSSGAPIHGDGMMYHLAVGPSGRIYLTRDLNDIRWHCANESGNETSVAVHLPLGGNQDATEAQWLSATRVFDALIEDYDLGGRSRKAIFGHREWPRDDDKKQSECPGDTLMLRLDAWRNEGTSTPPTLAKYRTIVETNIRQEPTRESPIAWDGTCILPPNHIALIDEVKKGEKIGGRERWYHLATGDGWGHESCFKLEP